MSVSFDGKKFLNKVMVALSFLKERPRYDLGQKAVTKFCLKAFARGVINHDRCLNGQVDRCQVRMSTLVKLSEDLGLYEEFSK